MKNRNPLIRKLLTQYFVTTGILLAFLVMIPLVIRFIAGTRTWYGTEPIYYILRFLRIAGCFVLRLALY
ncbi:hypothetical protein OM428_12115 [Enterococcus gallinarum]|nr:hypothetical protein [Enterococcus gallinarum]MCW3745350.1 hypothetical protein [Enterococcus gallinarum]